MKFAVVQGEDREPEPGLLGACRACGQTTIAKCGSHRVHHWAHKGTRTCDPWWESETQWHRDWKNHFPKEWQEAIHVAPDGEKHIADVKTAHGIVLEFQHSFLNASERQSRELFYPKMIWVVDGTRRARDRAQFFAAFGNVLVQKPLVVALRLDSSALLRDWKASRVPVYFDFGGSLGQDPFRFQAHTLWRLNPEAEAGNAYVSPVEKSYLVGVQREGIAFDEPFTAALAEMRATRDRNHQMARRQTAFPVGVPRRRWRL